MAHQHEVGTRFISIEADLLQPAPKALKVHVRKILVHRTCISYHRSVPDARRGRGCATPGNLRAQENVLCYNRDYREGAFDARRRRALMAATENLPRTLGE